MKEKLEQAVKDCAEKASKADKACDAQQYAQAALNLANALREISQ